jgi:regulator of chromosome condensation
MAYAVPPNQPNKKRRLVLGQGEDDAPQPRKKEKFEPGGSKTAVESTKLAEETKPTSKPPFNPLPVPPPHLRPAKHLFIFGNGDNNQFGLGSDTYGEIARPKLHSWVEGAVKEAKLGAASAGIESISAGGMHTLMIDEEGKVTFRSETITFEVNKPIDLDLG